MPKTIKKRIKKNENENTLGESVADIRGKLKERQRSLAYGFIICVLIIAAAAAFFIYSHINASRAAELDYEGYKIFVGASATPYASPQDRFKAALDKFRAAYGAKKNATDLLYMANCYYELGNLDETLKTLKELTDNYSDPKIASLAYYKMGITYLRKGDQNSALKTFETLSGIKDAPLQDMALFQSGKLLEAMGRTEDARNKYRELVNRFPNSALFNDANAKLGSQEPSTGKK